MKTETDRTETGTAEEGPVIGHIFRYIGFPGQEVPVGTKSLCGGVKRNSHLRVADEACVVCASLAPDHQWRNLR